MKKNSLPTEKNYFKPLDFDGEPIPEPEENLYPSAENPTSVTSPVAFQKQSDKASDLTFDFPESGGVISHCSKILQKSKKKMSFGEKNREKTPKFAQNAE